MKTYRFSWNARNKSIDALSEWEAMALFQERFGFWPSKDLVEITVDA